MLLAVELACELVEVAADCVLVDDATEVELCDACEAELWLAELCEVAELVTALELACETTELVEALEVTLLALAVEVLLDCAATELLDTAWLVLLVLVVDELVAAALVVELAACELVEVAALVDLALLALAAVFLAVTFSPVLTPGILMVLPAIIILGLLKPLASAILSTETLYFCAYAQTVSPALIVIESALATA